MTARGLALLVGAVLLAGVGRLLGVSELYVVGAAAGALLGVAAVAVRLASLSVAVRRSVSTPRLLPDATGEVSLTLRNTSRLPTTLLLIEDRCHPSLSAVPRFVVPSLGPSSTVELRYAISGVQRGRYPIGPLAVRVRDPFGLVERVRRYEATLSVLVYPRIEALGSPGARGNHQGSGSSTMRRLFASGDEFYTMREYVQGDDLRQVHWPSTAHRQTLMVRQQEQPLQAQATILCDTRGVAHLGTAADSTFEKAMSVAASAMWHLADSGYSLRLATDESLARPRFEPWEALLDRVAELQPSKRRAMAAGLGSIGTSGEGLLLAVLAPPPDDGELAASADVRALLQAGRAFTARMAVVVIDPGRRTTAARGRALAALLTATGWNATTVGVDEAFAPGWERITGRRRQAASTGAAYRPDALVVPAAPQPHPVEDRRR